MTQRNSSERSIERLGGRRVVLLLYELSGEQVPGARVEEELTVRLRRRAASPPSRLKYGSLLGGRESAGRRPRGPRRRRSPAAGTSPAWYSSAPSAPSRVCASRWAYTAPSENPPSDDRRRQGPMRSPRSGPPHLVPADRTPRTRRPCRSSSKVCPWNRSPTVTWWPPLTEPFGERSARLRSRPARG